MPKHLLGTQWKIATLKEIIMANGNDSGRRGERKTQ